MYLSISECPVGSKNLARTIRQGYHMESGNTLHLVPRGVRAARCIWYHAESGQRAASGTTRSRAAHCIRYHVESGQRAASANKQLSAKLVLLLWSVLVLTLLTVLDFPVCLPHLRYASSQGQKSVMSYDSVFQCPAQCEHLTGTP